MAAYDEKEREREKRGGNARGSRGWKALKAFLSDERLRTHRSMVAGRCSELRGGILSIYEKNPICVTRDAMLSVSAERQREKDGERENEGKRERGKKRGSNRERSEGDGREAVECAANECSIVNNCCSLPAIAGTLTDRCRVSFAKVTRTSRREITRYAE